MVCEALKDAGIYSSYNKSDYLHQICYQIQQDRIKTLELRVSKLEEIIRKYEEGYNLNKNHDYSYEGYGHFGNAINAIEYNSNGVKSIDSDKMNHRYDMLFDENGRDKVLVGDKKNIGDEAYDNNKIHNGDIDRVENRINGDQDLCCGNEINDKSKDGNLHHHLFCFDENKVYDGSNICLAKDWNYNGDNGDDGDILNEDNEACWDNYCELWRSSLVDVHVEDDKEEAGNIWSEINNISYYDDVTDIVDETKKSKNTDEKVCVEKMMLYDEVDSVFVQHEDDYDSLWEQITSDDQEDDDFLNSSPYFDVSKNPSRAGNDMFSIGNQHDIMKQNLDDIFDVDDVNKRASLSENISTLSHDDILKLNFDIDDTLNDGNYIYERIRSTDMKNSLNSTNLVKNDGNNSASNFIDNSGLYAEIRKTSIPKIKTSDVHQVTNDSVITSKTTKHQRTLTKDKDILPDFDMNTNLKYKNSKGDFCCDKFDCHGDNDEFEWDGLLSIHEEKQDGRCRGENNNKIKSLSGDIYASCKDLKGKEEEGKDTLGKVLVECSYTASPKLDGVDNAANMATTTNTTAAKVTRTKSIKKSISFRLKFKLKSDSDDDLCIKFEDKNKKKVKGDEIDVKVKKSNSKDQLSLTIHNNENHSSIKSQLGSLEQENNKPHEDKDVKKKRPLFRSLSLKHARDKIRRRSVVKENNNNRSVSREKLYRPIIEPKAEKVELSNLRSYSSDSCIDVKKETPAAKSVIDEWIKKPKNNLSRSNSKIKTPSKNAKVNDFKAVRDLMQNNKNLLPSNDDKDDDSREERYRDLCRAKKNYLKMLQEGTIRFEPVNQISNDTPHDSNDNEKLEKYMDGISNKKKKRKLSQRLKSTFRSIFVK